MPPRQATEKLQQLFDHSCSKFFSPYQRFVSSLIFFFQQQSGSNTLKQKSKDAAEKKDWSHPGSHTCLNNLYMEHSCRTSIFIFPSLLSDWNKEAPYYKCIYNTWFVRGPVLFVFFSPNPNLSFLFLLTSLCVSVQRACRQVPLRGQVKLSSPSPVIER